MANHRLVIPIGSKFGKLVVCNFAGRDKNGRICYECKCACGNVKIAAGTELKRGYIVSCGCKKKENARKSQSYHGHTQESIYNIWSGILQRCENKNNLNYKNYGARGITVCDDWHDFKKFYEWANTVNFESIENYSIERIDVNGNYCPENCTFIQRENQCLNKQNTLFYKGMPLKHFCKKNGLNYSSVHSRVHKLGWEIKKAVETPFIIQQRRN